MSAASLLALAERCEQAAGPDRGLDAEIARAVGHIPRSADYEGTIKTGDMAWSNGCGYEIPAYSASLDAAIALIPPGGDWRRLISDAMAVYSRNPYGQVAKRYDGFAKEPPLAMCAACLRAIAAPIEAAEIRAARTASVDRSPKGGDACGSIADESAGPKDDAHPNPGVSNHG